jgi:hypothetical protein
MRSVRKFGRFILVALLLVVAATACGGEEEAAEMDGDMAMDEGEMDMEMGMDAEVPEDLDTATTKPTANGEFVATIGTEMDPLPINEIHEWVLHIETLDGEPVDDATVTIGGGMPQHNHGFPTEPAVTESLGDGDYRVEGIRFNMAGWWTMEFEIEAGDVTDTVVFNVVLP